MNSWELSLPRAGLADKKNGIEERGSGMQLSEIQMCQ